MVLLKTQLVPEEECEVHRMQGGYFFTPYHPGCVQEELAIMVDVGIHCSCPVHDTQTSECLRWSLCTCNIAGTLCSFTARAIHKTANYQSLPLNDVCRQYFS